jgi:hypothetical protein
MAERNREILAERLGHPPETVEGCCEIERRCPGYFAWYSDGTMAGQPGPRYGARVENARYSDPTYYGNTPDDVVAQIQAEHRT